MHMWSKIGQLSSVLHLKLYLHVHVPWKMRACMHAFNNLISISPFKMLEPPSSQIARLCRQYKYQSRACERQYFLRIYGRYVNLERLHFLRKNCRRDTMSGDRFSCDTGPRNFGMELVQDTTPQLLVETWCSMKC